MTPEDRLSRLVERWREMEAQGQTPSATDLCSDCPELAGELERRLADRLDPVPVPVAHRQDLFATAFPPEVVPPPEAKFTAAPLAYEILCELGRGGMGVVYKARQTKLNRVVALKMILTGSQAADAETSRFRTEAEAIAKLQHPNVVQVYEVGEYGGLPFIALEFCAGGSLDRKLNGTPMQPTQAAALVRTLAEAVHAAHKANVIHRI